jgi:hypothetical protein
MCQKASGQPFMALARIKQGKLQWTRGTLSVFKSSNLVERGYCRDCGTPLTYRVIDSDDISVAVCSLDDPSVVPPTVQYGVESQLAWCASLPGLPRQSTEDSMPPGFGARLESRQHPDHDR